ncbi:probable cytochrome P450 6a14 [Culicoides brevitarsis]|uniref:probable cytochrome P450 6a14 n=1 Tax=Culicoides brevitarsis TaxID=469753 RepID=UPI00307C116F
MLLIILTSILGFALLFLAFLRHRFSYWKNRGFPSTSPCTPLGDFAGVGIKMHYHVKYAQLYNAFKKKTKFFGAFLYMKPTLFITDLDLLRTVLVKDFHYFEDRGVYYNEKEDPLTAHIFAIEGEKWRKMRNNLSPTFTSGKMKYMFHTISDKGQVLIDYIDKHFAKTGAVMEGKDVAQRFTADVIGSCAFGVEVHAFDTTKVPEIIKIAKGIFSDSAFGGMYFFLVSSYQSLARFLKLRLIAKYVEDYFMTMIKENVEYRETNCVVRADFFNMLLNLKNRGTIFEDKPENEEGKITFKELAAESAVFFFAGFETSSSTMNFALYLLASHPEVQEKVRAEVRRVKALHDNKISYEALMEMKYLTQVFDETLRMYPPVGNLSRNTIRDYKIPDTDLVVPQGTMISITVYGIHNDPDIYPEPEKFDPDRFTPEEVAKRHPYAYIPFGKGPRDCIGNRFGMLQVKFGLATILDNFKVEVNPKTIQPIVRELKTRNVAAKGGLWFNITRLED